MDRRRALTNIALAAGSIITLPSWMHAAEVNCPREHATSFNRLQQQTLAAVADTIIPGGSSVGALAVGVDKFLQKIFDDCYEADVQKNIKMQLESLERLAKIRCGDNFSACSQPQRLTMLQELRQSKHTNEKEFIELIRKETIRGYTTSQKVMQDLLGYEVAPGRYNGCVPVKS
jgi:hypothetical protein